MRSANRRVWIASLRKLIFPIISYPFPGCHRFIIDGIERSPRMTKRLLLMATLLGVLLLAGCTFKLEGQGVSPSGAQGLYPPAQQTGVWVTGEGKARYAPDVAILRLGIEAQEATVAQAQARAREAMGRVVAALKTRKGADKDIQTQHFSIQPVRQWIEEPGPGRKGREIIIGYRVSNTVTANARQINA